MFVDIGQIVLEVPSRVQFFFLPTKILFLVMLHFISFKIIHRFGYLAVKLDANEALKEIWHKRFSVTLIVQGLVQEFASVHMTLFSVTRKIINSVQFCHFMTVESRTISLLTCSPQSPVIRPFFHHHLQISINII